MNDNDLTTSETASVLELSEGTIRRLIGSGALRAEKRAGAWFIDACSIERLSDELLEDEDDEEDIEVDDDGDECEDWDDDDE